jgi:hypothetical protein
MCSINDWALSALLIPPTNTELNLIGSIQQLPDYELAWMREYHFDMRARVTTNFQLLQSHPEHTSELFNQKTLDSDFIYHCDQIEEINAEIMRRII